MSVVSPPPPLHISKDNLCEFSGLCSLLTIESLVRGRCSVSNESVNIPRPGMITFKVNLHAHGSIWAKREDEEEEVAQDWPFAPAEDLTEWKATSPLAKRGPSGLGRPSARSWEAAAPGSLPVLQANQPHAACRQLGTGGKKTVYSSRRKRTESLF